MISTVEDMGTASMQATVYAQEARIGSLFVAGWRPAFGWSIVVWLNIEMVASAFGHALPDAWQTGFGPAWAIFAGMMGLRTFEKWQGIATKAVSLITPKGA